MVVQSTQRKGGRAESENGTQRIVGERKKHPEPGSNTRRAKHADEYQIGSREINQSQSR